MECIKCGGKANVSNTTCSGVDYVGKRRVPVKASSIFSGPLVYRYHRCTECKHTFQSIEIPAKDFEDKMENMETIIKNTIKAKIAAFLDS